MTIYKTRTEEFGAIAFYAPAATDQYRGYVWAETERGYASRERRQICYGGGFTGSTVTATADGVKAAAQAWLRQRRVAKRAA